ncbi:molecular chaperone GrpE [Fructobacillus pseudoficulneus]|uniref:Protein GrpE n=1 Tax=Fructobacillus pseudoficulneus TaxID=220714 RepID=A0A3F3GSY3_9LACO|nr:nucleotide exchange factor GrpE [Fructobacillus pseudoficulneus]GAP02615.1 molecular chaperone GrpE [Fructobacillus pseudoficulneus]SEH38577.1 molecular chaperone GrpE [Fructobacillus pseudoficulneus]
MAKSKEEKDLKQADITEETEAEEVLDDTEETATTEKAQEADQEVEADPTAALKDELAEKDDALLRAQAEIQNIQARNAREIQNIRKYDGQKLAEAILPVVDNLERALAVEVGDDDQVAQIHKGVEITLKTLKQALTTNGIQEVGQVGDDFDPNTMQGVQSVPAEGEIKADQVAQVLQKGYVLQDRVIRPAMVAVAQ